MTELRRPVRLKNGKPLKCGIKRGTVLEADTVCAHVISEPRQEGGEWVFRVEVNGTWAAKVPKIDEYGIAELDDMLPGVLSWDELPDIQVGDKIVFATTKIRDANEGFVDRGGVTWPDREPINVDIPRLYIEITSIGRNKLGKHVAHYKKVGFQRDEYLAFKSGSTSSRTKRQCLDDEASVVEVYMDPRQQEIEANRREVRRLQQLRAAHQTAILSNPKPGRLVSLTVSLADVERKLAKFADPEMREAA